MRVAVVRAQLVIAILFISFSITPTTNAHVGGLDCADGSYTVVDSATGTYYNVWVMESNGGGKVRVAWNNQLPATYSGVVISWQGHEYLASEVDLTGACGVQLGATEDDYSVRVAFADLDVTRTHIEESSASITVDVSLSEEFEVGLTGVSGTVGVEFGLSTTGTFTSGDQISAHSTKAIFSQEYSHHAPAGGADTTILPAKLPPLNL